jgi:nucleoside-diphosphate-sugar epimerase
MKVLFVGGTGIISSACSEPAVERGYELDLLVRGSSSAKRPPPAEANILRADVRNLAEAKAALRGKKYDAVVDFVAFTTEHIDTDIELFGDLTDQFVFISSASAYHKPVRYLPITESTPLYNPYWEYSRNKIACEERLTDAYRKGLLKTTVIRPSHTYDKTLLPFENGGTVLHRMRKNQPVIVHGDGTSLWTLTHHQDFAVGLVGLLGNPKAIGETFHITSDESIPWNEIFLAVGRGLGKVPQLVHVPSDVLFREDPLWGDGLVGDKAHSVIFDNSKIKTVVPDFHCTRPFWQGALEIARYHEAHPNAAPYDPKADALMNRLIERYG